MSKKNSDIKLICFDLNHTLIEENSWEQLNLAMGVTYEEDQKMLEQYLEAKLSYDKWQKKLVAIYKKRNNLTRKEIESVVFNYTYKPHAKSVIKYLNKQGYTLALISGSMDMLVSHIAKELDIHYYKANNTIVFDEDDRVKEIKVFGDEEDMKLKQLLHVSYQAEVEIDEIACVGDGANEKDIFTATKLGITFKGSKLEDIAWKIINNLNDLKKIF